MTAPTITQGQLADALTQVRMSRHHQDCRCGLYQRHWCTSLEKQWCATVDRLLEAVREKRF